ncbi:MAG: hypothetical protein AMXMBFR42_13440 [Burkholderiales bacterium]
MSSVRSFGLAMAVTGAVGAPEGTNGECTAASIGVRRSPPTPALRRRRSQANHIAAETGATRTASRAPNA